MRPMPPVAERLTLPAQAGDRLAPAVIHRIELALERIGDFGEVRLIVVKGQLRFLEIVLSENLNPNER